MNPKHRIQNSALLSVTVVFTLAVVLLATFALAPQAAPGDGAEPPRERTPRGMAGGWPESVPHLAVDTGRSEPAPAQAPASLASWSKLVFQSLRDGNWEIYRADGDGSNQTRLTNNSGSDIQPRLNRGCSRIAFAAYRGSNYDIYAMNADGTGEAPLTWAADHDVNPAWSRDGTRVVFESYRSGQGEVFVMNADGSDQTRLTFEAAWDGAPAWSPDGSAIAFTSYRNSVYRIWRMNANGSGQVQLSNQPYSGHAAWSPDGSLIAYDADGDGDGFQELWLMNASGTSQYQVYDPPEADTDAWVGGWSPDGQYLAFTRISWIYYSGHWYWTTAYLDVWERSTGLTYRLSANGEDWYPDWQTVDILPPVSSMEALPGESASAIVVQWSGSDDSAGIRNYDVQVRDGASGAWTDWLAATTATSGTYGGLGGHTYYFRCRARDNALNVEAWPADYDVLTTVEARAPTSRVRPLPAYTPNGGTITWSGTDPGGSGIATYDVQVRDQAGGGWTDWQVGTAATSAPFSGTAGHTYDLRSRATDWAGNTEAWPAGRGDASTTLYTWGLTGVARDNTGVPVAGVMPATGPAAVGVMASDPGGWYAAYVAADVASYTATWTKAGYGSLPETAFDAGQDAVLDLVMPPADNVVVNWGFEDGADPGPAWQAGGTLPISITTAAHHTGFRGVEMGRTCTYPCLTDPQPLFLGWAADLVTDGAGNVHMVWITGTIEYSVRAPDGDWTEPISAAPCVYSPYSPHLAIDGTGILHLVWADSHTIYYSRQEPSGAWMPPQAIVTDPTFELRPSDLAVDSQGGLHIIYRYWDGVYHRERLPSGEWQPSFRLDGGDGYNDPGLAVGPDDTVHLVWQEISDGIYYRSRLPDGTWTAAERLFSDFGYSFNKQQIAVDPAGRPHLFWSWGWSGYYATQDEDGTWLPAVELPKARGDAGLTFDSQGILYMVNNTGIAVDEGTYFRQKAPDSGWTEPVQLSPNYWNMPSLAVDCFDILHAVWEDLGEIQYQTTGRADEADTATLSQAVTIPARMQAPVLSFCYQQRMTLPSGTSGLEVSLSDGVAATPLLSTTEASPWAPARAILQPWAGQQVTITFALRQGQGEPLAKLFLDEVSLGSAYPDLWVAKSGSGVARPGEPVAFVITYGNRAGVPASGVTVTDTLPAGFQFVSADPPPTTVTPYLTWQVGDLPPGGGPFEITLIASVEPSVPLGTALANVVVIGSSWPELETLNNEASGRVWVGWRVLLPVVSRDWW